jgi:hypothetical protein
MSDTYVVGKTITEFRNADDDYLFALRRTEDGDLYMLKSNISLNHSSVVELFGETPPDEFVEMDMPGDDYFEGRGTDHELVNTSAEVKYEQWKWVSRTQSYHIDSNGFLVLTVGEHLPVPAFEDVQIPYGHAQAFTLYGENYDVNLFDKLIQMGWNGISTVNLTIAGNLRSSHPQKSALYLDDRAFINGISIINTGNITGCNGDLTNNPVNDRNKGNAIAIETTVASFTNQGTIRAGSYNGQNANAFSGYSLITSYTNDGGHWYGYDD